MTAPRAFSLRRFPFMYWGAIVALSGFAMYLVGVSFALVRLVIDPGSRWLDLNQAVVWYSGVPTAIGFALIAVDLLFCLPVKRRTDRVVDAGHSAVRPMTVTLTAYNDELSIAAAVEDFRRHPLVSRVIVISNNSSDATLERAREAGAIVFNETQPGYGRCVYRCYIEALKFEDADHVVLCEGDRTFRAADLDKLCTYLPHAQIVNGTRIVEQLREYHTQLSTPMYYGNFFVGKLLELKHLGQGTFTDVGTTYKVIRRETLTALLPHLDPSVNLEFNAHFLDRALTERIPIVECPITFHARIGLSKGGNLNNRRASWVGLRMIIGLSFGWRWLR